VIVRLLLLALGLTLAPLAAADEPKPAPKKDGEKPLRSLVFLRSKPLKMTEATVIAALKVAFPKRTVGTEKTDDITVAATGIATICTLDQEKVTLLINSFPKPYVPDRAAMAKEVLRLTDDKAMAAAMEDHEAWFSVDILGEELTPKNEAAHYELLSKVIAPFHDKDATLLFFPEKNRLFAANEATLQSLVAGKALDLSKDLKAAVQTARKRWKEFEKAYTDGTGANHSVKFKFTDGKNGSEFMWVSVDKLDGDTVVGKLANVPNFLTNVKEGDVVKRPAKEIEDWLYVDDKKMVGGFSIRVLEDRQKKRKGDK
jgi:uncharacterized protein YegJ (DUF2314 family)